MQLFICKIYKAPLCLSRVSAAFASYCVSLVTWYQIDFFLQGLLVATVGLSLIIDKLQFGKLSAGKFGHA